MKKKAPGRPHGEVRQSQLLTTYGPGSMVDLPDYSVLIGGLEQWSHSYEVIHEPRLEAKAAEAIGVDSIQLRAPPTDEAAPEGVTTGITAWQFPEWFVVQYEVSLNEDMKWRSRPIVYISQLEKGRFRYDKKRWPVVPIRFVRACPKGHISDINWRRFVHTQEGTCQRQMWLDERGTSGDFDELVVRCECGKERSLASAYPREDNKYPLGGCGGERPWIGPMAYEPCKTESGKPTPAKLLIRSASNAYFSQVLSVIHIPDKSEELNKAIDLVWEDHLQFAEDEKDVEKERKRPKVAPALEGFTSAQVWEEIERRKSGAEAPTKKIKQTELETLLDLPTELAQDVADGDFYATTYALPSAPEWLTEKLDRVVLVHRLKEVRTQIGFTRFDSQMADVDGELDIEDLNRAPLSLEPKWLPAIENNGEGFFISFKASALNEWIQKPGVKERTRQLQRGFENWAKNDRLENARWAGPRYVLMHSLSHLLITAISLECGYAASSIRERIYVGPNASGILLFTGSPDAEGTLGGIVQVGRRIDKHLKTALEMGALCGNDPICAEHRPEDTAEERFLHGACCHGCLLIAEPSCEAQNKLLDRALVVPTVGDSDAAFFEDFG